MLKVEAMRTRNIGLGISGFADVLFALRLRYGSDESVAFADNLMAIIRALAIRVSADRAKALGAFPAIASSVWANPARALARLDLERVLNKPLPHFTGQCELDQSTLINDITAHGIRNATLLTVAPTGTTSLVLGVEGYGCEPLYSLNYKRKVHNDGEMTFISPALEHALGGDHATMEHVKANGTLPSSAPDWIKEVFGATANNVAPIDHLRMQAAMQCSVDSSISKTINCPTSTTIEEVEQIYMKAWQMGLKGLTIYRSHSRVSEVLTSATPSQPMVMVRPPMLRGATYCHPIDFGKVHITINELIQGQPFEIFVSAAKSGSYMMSDCEAIGRLASLVLRMGGPKAASQIINQLRGIGGEPRQLKTSPSIADAVARVLEKHMNTPSAKETTSDYCMTCGGVMIRQENCRHCQSCGLSLCS
jgi:ribonucleoside-diphosphate reductase alpha chain